MPLPAAILVLAFASLVTSAAALLYALRGRRVDDHPICRKCGFDLFGKPDGSCKCSECGADLARRRAMRVGQRERRGWLLQVAGPMLAIAVGWSGLLGWDAARRTDWNRHKPVWWLMRDVDGRSGPTRDAALVELGRRITDGKLPPDRSAALVDRALDWQADASKPWSPGWGVIVESARAADLLPYAKWERYMAQSATFTLEAFKPGRLFGEPETSGANRQVGLRVRRGPDRVGKAKFNVEVRAESGATLGAQRAFPTKTTGMLPYAVLDVPAGSRSIGAGGSIGEMVVIATDLRDGSGGASRATATLNVRGIRSPDGVLASLIVAVLAKEPAWRPVTLSTEWTTLPDDPGAPTSAPAEYGVEVN